MQVGLVVCGDGGDPGVEAVPVTVGEDLREGFDVLGEGVQVGAGSADLGEAGAVGGVQCVGVA